MSERSRCARDCGVRIERGAPRARARAFIADVSRAGLHSDYELTILLVFTTLIMLLVTLIAIVWQARSVATQPTLRLCATGAQPELTLARGCRYHTFVSHVWGTGQDQVHTLVRQLQLLLPGVRVWLDVDSLTNVGALEESIRQSQTVIIFLSEGYFASRNCRRAPRSRRDRAEIDRDRSRSHTQARIARDAPLEHAVHPGARGRRRARRRVARRAPRRVRAQRRRGGRRRAYL